MPDHHNIGIPISEAPRMDWKALMQRLRERGWTQAKLLEWLESQGVECGQATLSDLARGASVDPKFKLGDALRRLDASEQTYQAAPADEAR